MSIFHRDVSLMLPLTREVTELMRKKERETQLHTSLNAVLSCRLREGYAIKEVAIVADQIEVRAYNKGDMSKVHSINNQD